MGSAAGFYDQYQAGQDPAGITTQDPELQRALDPEDGGRRVANYLRVLTMEAQTVARACGKAHVTHLEPEDMVAISLEAAAMAKVPLAGTDWIPGRPSATTGPSDMADRKVIVVGGGLIGLSIARSLTARGVSDVLVLERALLASGGTGKSSGIVRAHYGVPSIAKLSWNSVPVMEELGGEVGFRQVGYSVIVGEENVAALEANTAMQQALGIETELIDVDRLAGLWPLMETSDVVAAAYEPRGGFADATQLALHFGRVARDHGARIRQNTAGRPHPDQRRQGHRRRAGLAAR